MIQTLLTYPIVALAAAWLLWSIILPAHTRGTLQRRLGFNAPGCATGGGSACAGCGEAGCPLVTIRQAAARAEPLGTRP